MEARETLDARQELSDLMIGELNAEIDRDTVKRFNRGERLIRTENGPEWVYVMDDNKQITDPDRLNSLLGHLMY